MDFSILDYCVIPTNGCRETAIYNSISLAQFAEKLGYKRIWFAEHHKNIAFAGCAPEIIIPLVASKTTKIRVGSGGILLNHYSPYKVAEVFSLLSHIFPGRIDLGVGKSASGGIIDAALQHNFAGKLSDLSYDKFAMLYSWLTDSFTESHPLSKLKIHCDPSLKLWMLGASEQSALVAGKLGLPYAFAGFINQKIFLSALTEYRSNFAQNQNNLANQRVILCIHMVCAETREAAERLLGPLLVMFEHQKEDIVRILPGLDEALNMLKSRPPLLQEEQGNVVPLYIGGTPDMIVKKVEQLSNAIQIDEIMIHDLITDHSERINSYRLISEAFQLTTTNKLSK